jgi:hypothetical protein
LILGKPGSVPTPKPKPGPVPTPKPKPPLAEHESSIHDSTESNQSPAQEQQSGAQEHQTSTHAGSERVDPSKPSSTASSTAFSISSSSDSASGSDPSTSGSGAVNEETPGSKPKPNGGQTGGNDEPTPSKPNPNGSQTGGPVKAKPGLGGLPDWFGFQQQPHGNNSCQRYAFNFCLAMAFSESAYYKADTPTGTPNGFLKPFHFHNDQSLINFAKNIGCPRGNGSTFLYTDLHDGQIGGGGHRDSFNHELLIKALWELSEDNLTMVPFYTLEDHAAEPIPLQLPDSNIVQKLKEGKPVSEDIEHLIFGEEGSYDDEKFLFEERADHVELPKDYQFNDFHFYEERGEGSPVRSIAPEHLGIPGVNSPFAPWAAGRQIHQIILADEDKTQIPDAQIDGNPSKVMVLRLITMAEILG